MYKFVVFCAIVAAAAAKPGAIFADPFASFSTYIAPGSTTITKSASSIIHPSPLAYSTPYSTPYTYTHFIKKRSPQYPLGYFAPTTYLTSSPAFAATTYTAPLVTAGAPVLHSTYGYPTAHLIKKRSLLPSAYVATPYASAPYLTSTYSAATPLISSTYAAGSPLISSTYAAGSPLISTPYISSPLGYSTHFIKKRSAPFVTTYAAAAAPAAVSHQSRFDVSSTSPLIYSSASYYPHVYGAPTSFVY